ncbi:hypothetical protein CY35_16G032700 [Sphagnum magellanicum]|nr:hypothetical protein CY35_16G032700 [Sphagnum magellanicum]KAH9537081.1 hypothetical protein CY35_16G032700 [Sphagnum magellanicum]
MPMFECGTEQVKAEPMVLGSGDLAVYLNDNMYTEDDICIINPPSKFELGDDDPEDTEIPLYRKESDLGKMDFNWDDNFGTLEDVEKLFRTDSSFGQTCEPNGDGLQWPQGAICSSDLPESNCDGAANDKVDASDMKLEFVSVDTPTCPSLDISQVPNVKEQCLDTDVTSRSLPGPVQLQLPQQLPDLAGSGQMVKGIANAMTPIWKSQDDSEAPSLIFSSSERASRAQVHRARRHAANRKRLGGRFKRHLHSQKTGQEVQRGHREWHLSQLMPLQMPMHSNLSLPPSVSVQPVPSAMQAVVQPLMPYMPPAYPQPLHPVPTLAPTPSFPGQVHQQPQEMYNGCQQPFSIPHQQPHLNQHQLRPLLEVSIPVPASSPIMTPEEKLEKLRWRQQMQASLAVGQLASQVMTCLDAPVLSKLIAQPQEVLAACEPEPEPEVNTLSSNNPETPRSVGQSSAGALLNEEDETLPATVLHQLESTMMKLELGTRLDIRDALYRLAESAKKRQLTPADSGNNSQISGDTETSSGALMPSIGGDTSSQHRVSRPVQPSSDSLWMWHSTGLPTDWSDAAAADLLEGMAPVMVKGVDNGFATFAETSMHLSPVDTQLAAGSPTAIQSSTDDLTPPFDQQKNLSSYIPNESNVPSQPLQQRNIPRCMTATEMSSGSANKQGEKLSDSPQASSSQGASNSEQQECYGMKKGVQPSRLQRAAGIDELTKYVEEMASLGSPRVKDESLTISNPPLVISSASDKWQPANLFKDSGIPVP